MPRYSCVSTRVSRSESGRWLGTGFIPTIEATSEVIGKTMVGVDD